MLIKGCVESSEFHALKLRNLKYFFFLSDILNVKLIIGFKPILNGMMP